MLNSITAVDNVTSTGVTAYPTGDFPCASCGRYGCWGWCCPSFPNYSLGTTTIAYYQAPQVAPSGTKHVVVSNGKFEEFDSAKDALKRSKVLAEEGSVAYVLAPSKRVRPKREVIVEDVSGD